ncbi:MAG: biopolymer transporter ExbD [Akkermansia sp.]
MKRDRISLGDGGWPLIVLAAINLMLLLCIIFVLQNHQSPHFGMNVRMASSSFVMGNMNRQETQVLTVAAGDTPRFFLGSKPIAGTWAGLNRELSRLREEQPNQINLIIVADESVTIGTLQRLMDEALILGFNCSIAARPPSL